MNAPTPLQSPLIGARALNCVTKATLSISYLGYSTNVALETKTFWRKPGRRELGKHPGSEGRAVPEGIRKRRRGPAPALRTSLRGGEQALLVLRATTCVPAATRAALARMEGCRPGFPMCRLHKLPLSLTRRLSLQSIVHRLVHNLLLVADDLLLHTTGVNVGCDDLCERGDC